MKLLKKKKGSQMKNQLLTLLLISTISIKAQVQLGPIVGGVTDSSAIILVKTYSEQEVEIELFTQEDFENSVYS